MPSSARGSDTLQAEGLQRAGELARAGKMDRQQTDGRCSFDIADIIVYEKHIAGNSVQTMTDIHKYRRIPLALVQVIRIIDSVEMVRERRSPVDLIQPVRLVAEYADVPAGRSQSVRVCEHCGSQNKSRKDLFPHMIVRLRDP